LRARPDVVTRNAGSARAFRCQHFFKREAVFLSVLVYSEWRVLRSQLRNE
jgi:hypothetical protein